MSMDSLIVVDGVQWKADRLLEVAGADMIKRDKARTAISSMLALVPSDTMRGEYVKILAKRMTITRKELENSVRNVVDKTYAEAGEGSDERLFKLPDGVDPAFVAEWGFYEVGDGPRKTGYWFDLGREKRALEVSNCIVRPLFHLYSAEKDRNKRMIEINNGYVAKVIEVPSKAMISVEGFSGELVQEGNFLFSGARPHLLRLNEYWGDKFPLCYELTNLGWQKEGFFAYSDKVYNGDLLPYNEYGVIVHDEKHFYSPGANKKRTVRREEAGKFDADHQLRYSKAPVSFEEWCHMVAEVYPDHYLTAIGVVCMALCRDMVLGFMNSFPLLYCYGERQSGKSEFGLSIMSVFLNDAKMFNLNSGTDAAFFTFVGRYANCFVGLNEYGKDIRPEWHESIKGFYDNEGRKRNKDKYTMEEQAITCMAGLFGQYLNSNDDNAVPSRSLLCQFMAKPNRSQAEIDNFQKLMTAQKKGLNGMLCEVLEVRTSTLENGRLKDMYDSAKKELREKCKLHEARWEDRVGSNYALLITFGQWAAENWRMPYNVTTVKEYAYQQMTDVVTLMHTSDVLIEWWHVMSNLASAGVLKQGWHYKIKHALALPGRKNGHDIIFGEDGPRKVVMMRLSVCHAEYLKEMGKTKAAMSMPKTSLEGYFKNRDYFLGTRDGEWFTTKDDRTGRQLNSQNTSVHVFDYDILEKLSIYMNYDLQEEIRENHLPSMEQAAAAGYNPNAHTEPKTADDELPF